MIYNTRWFCRSHKLRKITTIPNGVTPVLPKNPKTLNDSRCNSLSTEVGVLTPVTGHGPIPPKGGTYYHLGGYNSTSHLYPHPGTRTRLLIRWLLIRVILKAMREEPAYKLSVCRLPFRNTPIICHTIRNVA
ncbi:hypothetical protein AVEN_246003-1 [Araneus ventricosus]|uniref:Uncharacterized protein n=1 Tax=Araneus ventricosus TaxID=182803 RepID=A0A4Y2FEV9_ARAVE|nr:hypothetical protein AVEN_246003-1 [Araneus ventricosus]